MQHIYENQENFNPPGCLSQQPPRTSSGKRNLQQAKLASTPSSSSPATRFYTLTPTQGNGVQLAATTIAVAEHHQRQREEKGEES